MTTRILGPAVTSGSNTVGHHPRNRKHLMGAKENLKESLKSFLEAGERIETWRSVVANGRVEDSSYQTTLALLGPSIFSRHAQGHIASSGEVPERTTSWSSPIAVSCGARRAASTAR